MKRGKPEITEVIFTKDHLKIRWICKNCGFGELDLFSISQTNGFDVYTECLGEAFYKEILEALPRFLLKESIIKE